MGGRGARKGGATGGAGGFITETTSLLSARETKTQEVDEVMAAVKSVYDWYGVDLTDIQLAKMGARRENVLAYYDSRGNLAINERYFDSAKMNAAYDDCIALGFHPPRGNKSALEATAAHELGHRLNHELAGGDWGKMDAEANSIVAAAKKSAGFKSVDDLRRSISGYATQDNAETIAEAFADVYCNKGNASRASAAVVAELNARLGR